MKEKRIGDIVAFCVGCLFVLLIFLSIEIVFRSVKKDIKPTRISIPPFIECTEQGKKVLPNIKGEEKVIVGEKTVTSGTKEYTEPIFSEAGIVFKVTPEVKIVGDEEKILLDEAVYNHKNNL